LTTEEFLAQLKGRNIRIVPKIRVELDNGETMVIEADCSGCNNANQPIPYSATPPPKRWADD
jgi:hypothetical protein